MISREEREFLDRELTRINREIHEVKESLRFIGGPESFGTKDAMKGLLEQQLANLERQREHCQTALDNAHL